MQLLFSRREPSHHTNITSDILFNTCLPDTAPEKLTVSTAAAAHICLLDLVWLTVRLHASPGAAAACDRLEQLLSCPLRACCIRLAIAAS